MQKHRCAICNYVYDPEIGDETNGTPAETAFEDLPEEWTCPNCGVDKTLFEPI